MKVTYNWLKDFVEIKIRPLALADRLTMAGLEVVSLEERNGDFVYEIEITSNRPDWLSVEGIAREISAITGCKLRAPRSKLQTPNSQLNKLAINIENKTDCPLYTAKIIEDVLVGPSPEWLRKRLESIGCRSINNVVDITNYILFTYGEPLHAFDADKLVGSQVSGVRCQVSGVSVRRAKDKEEIITIDGVKRTLDRGILLITSGADSHAGIPIAIAGIMGGKDTEVTEATKNILLEAAVFNPVLIRKARQKLGVQTDSSYRFERGIDVERVESASLAAVELLKEVTSGKFCLSKIKGAYKSKIKTVVLDIQKTNRILGTEISAGRIKEILRNLGFLVRPKAKGSLLVTAPCFRQDINQDVDLIEEIARIYGYDSIRETLPAVKPGVAIHQATKLISLTRDTLVGLGVNEAITHSLIDKDVLKDFYGEQAEEVIEILNPLSKAQEILRPKLIPSLAYSISLNLNQKQEYIALFEIGNAFFWQNKHPKEELTLSIGLCGNKSYVSMQGLIKEEMGMSHLKGILEALFEKLGIADYSLEPLTQDLSAAVFISKEKIGVMGVLPAQAADKAGIKNKKVFIMEISLEKVFQYSRIDKRFIPLPKYPALERDVSFILKEEVSIRDILAAIRERGGILLENIKIADYYKGKQIPDGFKGLTLSCSYRAKDSTLTEEQVNPVHSAICSLLLERFEAKIR